MDRALGSYFTYQTYKLFFSPNKQKKSHTFPSFHLRNKIKYSSIYILADQYVK